MIVGAGFSRPHVTGSPVRILPDSNLNLHNQLLTLTVIAIFANFNIALCTPSDFPYDST